MNDGAAVLRIESGVHLWGRDYARRGVAGREDEVVSSGRRAGPRPLGCRSTVFIFEFRHGGTRTPVRSSPPMPDFALEQTIERRSAAVTAVLIEGEARALQAAE